MASVEDNFKKFSKNKKVACSQRLCTAGLDVFSTVNWMTSSYSNADTEGSSLIFPVVTQQGTSTNNTDIAGTVTNSTSISGATPSHLKAAFP